MTGHVSRRISYSQDGFSLVELLITALIFSIGLLGLAALQVSTLRANTGGRNRFTAASLAEGCLSSIQSEGSLSWTYASGELGKTAVYPIAKVYTGAGTAGTFGYFDVNGKPLLVGDPSIVFTVSWARLDTTAATPKASITGMNMSEFVVTTSWKDQVTDAAGAPIATPTISVSRLIRY